MNASTPLGRSQEISAKVAHVFPKRMQIAQEHFGERLADAAGHDATRGVLAFSPASFDPLAGYRYAFDAMQRSIFFWDTLRERGTAFVEQSSSGLEPALDFDYNTIVDGRTFARPLNYALLKIKPPPGVTISDGEQEIIARYEPEQALVTLPKLLADRIERKRILMLLDKLVADERVQRGQPTDEQRPMLERIRTVLLGKAAREPRAAALAR